MKARNGIRLTLCIVGTVALTFLTVRSEEKRQLASQTDVPLRLARQVASQAEGLALSFRQKGDRDAVGSAADLLNQGVDPRAIQVKRRAFESKDGASEKYELNEKEGVLVLDRLLFPESGAGVRIQVEAPHSQAFLFGAGSRFEQDLRALLFAVSFFSILLGLTLPLRARTRSAVESEKEAPPITVEAPVEKREVPEEVLEVKASVRSWIGEARGVLMQLGVHVRELLRSSQALARAASNSGIHLTRLRQAMRTEIGLLRLNLHSVDGSLGSARAAETLLKAWITQASKDDLSDPVLREILQLLDRAGTLEDRNLEVLTQVEGLLASWLDEAEASYQSYQTAMEVTQDLSRHVTETSESLKNQAKMIQELRPRVEASQR